MEAPLIFANYNEMFPEENHDTDEDEDDRLDLLLAEENNLGAISEEASEKEVTDHSKSEIRTDNKAINEENGIDIMKMLICNPAERDLKNQKFSDPELYFF